jgi:thiamine-monophosphate kinase
MNRNEDAPAAVDEFDLIALLMRPLAQGAPEALGLMDDAAVVPPQIGQDLIVSADMMVEGVHFLPADPMDQVAQKLLRVNLSDLAAKGAEPYGYFLSVAWPARCGWAERKAFAEGLERDQRTFGLKLLGGDTTSTPGPLAASVTILGRVPCGRAVLRSTAKAGDAVMVSGQIGDGWLGLQAALRGDQAAAPLRRYRIPQPRTALREMLRKYAHAAADVSDGLIADAGRIAEASGLGLTLALERTPLSQDGRAFVEDAPDRLSGLLTLAGGGDDYEIVFTVAEDDVAAATAQAAVLGESVAVIGRMVEGLRVRVLFEGREIRVENAGYRHI